MAKFAAKTEEQMGAAAKCEQDFRKVLEKTDVDAVTIATPDHWHAPMAILALQAGKHVYVEKPCSHNPAEGVMLVSESEIKAAVRFLLTRMKMLVEPSGAVAAAAVLHNKLPPGIRSVGVVISGGNVDLDVLADVCREAA